MLPEIISFYLSLKRNHKYSIRNCNIMSWSGIHLCYLLQSQKLLVVLTSSLLCSFGTHPYLITVSETAEFLVLCQFTSATDLIAALAWTNYVHLEGDNCIVLLSLFTTSGKPSLILHTFKLWNFAVPIFCSIHNELQHIPLISFLIRIQKQERAVISMGSHKVSQQTETLLQQGNYEEVVLSEE